MFALWYSVLSYKEYRNSIWEKLSYKKSPGPKETAVVCPLPSKKNDPTSRIPIVEPPKPSRTPSPQIPATPPTPQPQVRPPPLAQKPSAISMSKPRTPELPPPQKIEPPPKPPRSPSPHPIRAEVFDDIEYEEESEESSDPEEEENSVLATPQRKPVAKSVNDFIDREKTA
ncbi:uncharacterized protein [Euwallacea similis]|uniref:uncharacterized protein n=1 Tax=Euwallacea similis TaxID=1736056 RepID=UPI00344FA235